MNELALILIFTSASLFCELLESKSRKYYADQWLLRGSGFFAGLAVATLVSGLL